MKKRTSLIFSALALIVLSGFFGYVYFDDHAWGAWGDDSAGYIFLAGQMYNDQPLVYSDELAKAGLDHFGDEKLARWLTPTHHQFINTQGTLASKYPVGIAQLLHTGAVLSGSSEGFYRVIPTLAVLNVLLVFVFVLLLFPKHKYRHVIGFAAAFFLGISNLYYDYAIAQPMREIPSITFILLTAILLVCGVRAVKKNKKWYWTLGALGFAGLAFGEAFGIRETTAVMLPAMFIYAAVALWEKGTAWENVKRLYGYVIAFIVGMVIALIPLINNSIDISSQKEVFKARDTSSVVVLSNIGHLETLSLSNVFGSEGKFRPGRGSLPHYWDIMQKSTPVPYFLVLAFLGIYYLWKRSRPVTTLLVLWGLGVLTIFSMWINPYSRYILPMFPPLLILGTYGLVAFLQEGLPTIVPKRKFRIVLAGAIILTFILAFLPKLQDVQANLREDVYRFKAIAQTDLQSLYAVADSVNQEDNPVLLFSGDWQYGISETLQAHTGVKTIRFPYDQRFEFDEEQVDAFFDQMLADGYDLYVWQDTTSSGRFFQWFEQFNTELVATHGLTFEPDARIYKILDRK